MESLALILEQLQKLFINTIDGNQVLVSCAIEGVT